MDPKLRCESLRRKDVASPLNDRRLPLLLQRLLEARAVDSSCCCNMVCGRGNMVRALSSPVSSSLDDDEEAASSCLTLRLPLSSILFIVTVDTQDISIG